MTLDEMIKCQEARVVEIKYWLIRYKDDRNKLDIWTGRLDEAEQALCGMRMFRDAQ